MTTILLPTFGSAGDVNPFVVIGRELQRRGHRAILVTNPHFQNKIEAAGLGTMAQALAAGIPHLVMPMGHDQPDNALRLERLGVGRALPPKKFTADRVAAALGGLLDDDRVQARCRELAARVDFAAAVGDTCDLILSLVRR